MLCQLHTGRDGRAGDVDRSREVDRARGGGDRTVISWKRVMDAETKKPKVTRSVVRKGQRPKKAGLYRGISFHAGPYRGTSFGTACQNTSPK